MIWLHVISKTKDKEIAYKLITSHLRLVVKVVSKYRGYGLPVGEMISEGNIGLMYAIDKFAPEKDSDFQHTPFGGLKHRYKIYPQLVVFGKTGNNRSAEKTVF